MKQGGVSFGRILGGPRTNATSKDGDEDLLLFRDLHTRDKGQGVDLLQSFSEDLDSNSFGNYPMYRIASIKKGIGAELLTERGGKNDYNWLKTPPATPLFPSLEMEANDPELATIVQKEIPIFQPPLTRFSGNNSEVTSTISRTKSPKPTRLKVHSRSVTPSTRPSSSSSSSSQVSSTERKQNKAITPTYTVSNQKIIQRNTDMTKRLNNVSTVKANNSSKTVAKDLNSLRDPSRGAAVSRIIRPTTPTTMNILGLSDETPPNLRTYSDRSSSASRGRRNESSIIIHPMEQKSIKPRRQSCSPSMSRGRKVDQVKQEESQQNDVITTIGGRANSRGGNGSLVFGSSMVDKVMNARKTSTTSTGTDGRESKARENGGNPTNNECSGFGRYMSKNSYDVALQHMKIKQNSTSLHQANHARNSTTATYNANSRRLVQQNTSVKLEAVQVGEKKGEKRYPSLSKK